MIHNTFTRYQNLTMLECSNFYSKIIKIVSTLDTVFCNGSVMISNVSYSTKSSEKSSCRSSWQKFNIFNCEFKKQFAIQTTFTILESEST